MVRLIVSIILSWILLGIFSRTPKIKFEELAMGKATTTYYAKNNSNDFIHLGEISLYDELYNDWVQRGRKDVILLIGNSQYHGINQMKPNDVNTSEILFNYYNNYNYDFLTFSMANINLQEQYLIFDYATRIFPIKMFILPVFMDDTRENSIRYELQQFMLNNVTYAEKNRIIDRLYMDNTDLPNVDLQGLKKALQEKVEFSIDEYLLKISSRWSARSDLRSELFGVLYQFRNFIFNIKATTTRKKIIGPYKDNIFAYELMLKHSRSMRINTLIYIPPIRNDVKIPYNEEEYINFKNEVDSLAVLYDANFKVIEDIIPSDHWGLRASQNFSVDTELDFMHFQYDGHKILADTLINYINNILFE